jgi:hypothetical protein
MHRVIRTNPKRTFPKNRVIVGLGMVNDSFMMKRKNVRDDDFAINVNPIASKPNMKNIDQKQMSFSYGSMSKPKPILDIGRDIPNNVSFKQSSKNKPKRVKLVI